MLRDLVCLWAFEEFGMYPVGDGELSGHIVSIY